MALFNSESGAYTAVHELRGLGFKDGEIQSITRLSRSQLYKAEIGKLEPLEDRRAAASYLAFMHNAKRYAELAKK